MAAQFRNTLTNDRRTMYTERKGPSQNVAGNVTATPAANSFLIANAGKVTNVFLSVGVNGVDVTNPLSLSVSLKNVTQNKVITSTGVAIAKAAGAGVVNTFAAGTGITLPVLTAANTSVARGDQLQFTWTLTRTASPGTEIADAVVMVEITETADYDPLLG